MVSNIVILLLTIRSEGGTLETPLDLNFISLLGTSNLLCLVDN